jgi:DNA-directed RNA polymerase specialized sigma24 family protein
MMYPRIQKALIRRRGARMADGDSFQDVLKGLRSGDADAVAVVHERFAGRLAALALRQFDGRLRDKADCEDVVQSALLSAVRRIENGEYDLGSWAALWGLLARITLNKCAHRRAYLRAGCRDARREAGRLFHEPAEFCPEPTDSGPTPEEAAVLAETLEQWLETLDPLDRSVIEQGLRGDDDAAIARGLLRSERSVRRVRQRAESQLRRIIAEEEQEQSQS